MNIPDFIYGVTSGDVCYDIETYPNAFTVWFLHRTTRRKWYFEISFRQNDLQSLCRFIEILGEQHCRTVGYNNIGFDYPVLHFIYKHSQTGITVADIYNKAMSIINSNGPASFSHMVWESQWLIEQIDLCKIHHFNIGALSTGLKILEFNMRMESVEDLPFPVGTVLTSEQIEILKQYNWHDVNATDLFLTRTESKIKLREELSKTFNKNMINLNDIALGETILVTEIEKRGVCYEYINNKKIKRQTKREQIDLSQVIFNYVKFENQSFQQVMVYLQSKIIKETKGVFKDLIATIDGFEYHFGTGGLHASIDSKTIYTDDKYQIIDIDVASYYPNLGIKNKLYPAHLGVEFCDAYSGVYDTRKKYKKGTPENEAFKLALNGAYGGSNNEYSPFFDPFYTMVITINGQLLLCMLIEQLIKTPGLKMVQANTDGVTYLCPHEYVEHTRSICKWWEKLTQLELEEGLYNRMFIRDVNNYIAEKQNGELKRIGVYAHVTAEENPGTRELPHHKNWSARMVALAAEARLVRGVDIKDFIESHNDVFDFFLRTKVPRSSILEWGGGKVSNIVRYYMSTEGKTLEKIMPPKGPEGEYKRANKLTDSYFTSIINEIGSGVWDERIHTKNKSTYSERKLGINAGWNVNLCNDLNLCEWFHGHYHPADLNYEWYIKETEKIVNPLL